METITHSISIAKPTSEVFEAFTSLGGMRSWWTNAISGNPDKGGELKQEFGMDRHVVYLVTGLKKNSFMTLTGTSSNFAEGKELIGTTLTLKVATNAAHHTNLSFTYGEWKDKTPFYKSQSKAWDIHLQSLKKLCESGKGDPEIVILARK